MTIKNTYVREGKKDNFVIPNCILRLAMHSVAKRFGILGRDGLIGSTAAIEAIKFEVGPEFSHVSPDMIRKRIGLVTRTPSDHGGNWTLSGGKNRGQRPVEPFSDEYIQHLDSAKWKEFAREILQLWEGRCAICFSNKSISVHHRTYIRLGSEKTTDVIPVCKACHKLADGRRRRTAELGRASSKTEDLF